MQLLKVCAACIKFLMTLCSLANVHLKLRQLPDWMLHLTSFTLVPYESAFMSLSVQVWKVYFAHWACRYSQKVESEKKSWTSGGMDLRDGWGPEEWWGYRDEFKRKEWADGMAGVLWAWAVWYETRPSSRWDNKGKCMDSSVEDGRLLGPYSSA